MSGDSTGVLLIRVWKDGPDALRARITHRLDVTEPTQTVTFASSPEEINTVVTAWLQAFLQDRSADREHGAP